MDIAYVYCLIHQRYGDEQLFQTHGMDAMMFIKFVRMMLYISALISIYGFVVLFAVNATGENTVCSPSLPHSPTLPSYLQPVYLAHALI